MPDRIKRKERLGKMSKIDRDLEKLETLNDFINIYKQGIKNYLNGITTDTTLQSQIRESMNINN